jgi:hypothetical protein
MLMTASRPGSACAAGRAAALWHLAYGSVSDTMTTGRAT